MRIDTLTSASARSSVLAPTGPLPGQDFAEALRRGIDSLASIQAAADQAAQSVAVPSRRLPTAYTNCASISPGKPSPPAARQDSSSSTALASASPASERR